MKNNLAVTLGLTRPIVIFDLETTGLSVVNDKIVELAYIKHWPDGRIEQEDLLFNPGRPIPPEVSAIHGISDEQVKDSPLFATKAIELMAVFSDSYYSGFNVVRFDLPLLRQEFSSAGQNFSFKPEDIIDAKLVYHYKEPRDLSAAYRFYCNKEHVDAHNALADVSVTGEIIAEQITRYGYEEIRKIHEETCRDYVDLEGRFYRENGEVYFNFSKFKDRTLKSVSETDPTFLRWILQADFSEDSKNVVRNFLNNKSL
ncbi:MAG: 3'-5' exonuclease [Candidatus Falkowbacteria bacterium]|nr:3'-5' exonuclease [Candidatus Falkowbacteria bacterium]